VEELTVIGISGSPRANGNTDTLVRLALKVLEGEGLRTEFVSLRELRVEPCRACRTCRGTKKCAIDDDVPQLLARLAAADGFILGAPVYFSGTAGQMKCFIDRVGYLSAAQGRLFERKVGAPLTVARRAGHNFALAEMMFLFLHQGMIIPGSTYWNIAFGADAGDVVNDEEGMRTVENLARNIAWTLRKLHQ
jgi:multimeric flavodoxin WrbA